MQSDPEIITDRIELSPEEKEVIGERTRRLERFYPHLSGCSVNIVGPRPDQGRAIGIRIDLRILDADPIVVVRRATPNLDEAIRRGFDLATRELDDFVRIQRGR